MAFCNQCGSQLPEGAKFCNKCGNKMADPAPAASAPAQEAAPKPAPAPAPAPAPKPKAPADPVKTNCLVWMLYVLLGVSTIGLIDLSNAYNNGMSVFFGVVAYLTSLGFIAMGVMRMIFGLKASGEDKTKQKFVGITCFALSILLFFYTLFMTIAIWVWSFWL